MVSICESLTHRRCSNSSTHRFLILEVGNSFGALDDLSDQLHPIWVELEQGGHGVAVFMAQDLAQWAVSEDTTNPVVSAK